MNLDDVIPHPRHRTCYRRVIGAPPPVVWEELHRVTMSALPLGRALEGARLLPARIAGRKVPPLARLTFFDVTPVPVLSSDPPTAVIAAGLSQPWRLLGGSTPPSLDAAAVRASTTPGWVKVGMEYRLEAVSGGTLATIETRVVATDPRTDRAFAAYWFLIRAASGVIRRELLRTVARRSEAMTDTA